MTRPPGAPIRYHHRACKLCKHAQREGAEYDLLHGMSAREVSAKYGVMAKTARVHLAKHMTHAVKMVAREQKRRGYQASGDLMRLRKRLERVIERMQSRLADPYPIDLGLVQAWRGLINEARGCATDMARISGEMPTAGALNVVIANWVEGTKARDAEHAKRLIEIGAEVEDVTEAEGLEASVAVVRAHRADHPGEPCPVCGKGDA